MSSDIPERIRETVYVVGAGFSAGLGYPLTKSLLINVWSKLEDKSRDQLEKIIKFHHPEFNPERATTFPDIEQLLTEMKVNIDLFNASRPGSGNFSIDDLVNSHKALLTTIARWFHELYKHACGVRWLPRIIEKMKQEEAAIISFNWDLVLDYQLFSSALDCNCYGLAEEFESGPLLLKPHGSLNWYESKQIRKVDETKRVRIFDDGDADEQIDAFCRPREIRSKRQYTPFIVPPTYLKDFNRPIFRRLWNHCTEVLSTPKRLIFLGYSLPAADLHAQFILRCGFYNQIEGRLKGNKKGKDGIHRYDPTGAAEVTIVNPEQEAARRIEAVAGPDIHCAWLPMRIEEWLEHEASKHSC